MADVEERRRPAPFDCARALPKARASAAGAVGAGAARLRLIEFQGLAHANVATDQQRILESRCGRLLASGPLPAAPFPSPDTKETGASGNALATEATGMLFPEGVAGLGGC